MRRLLHGPSVSVRGLPRGGRTKASRPPSRLTLGITALLTPRTQIPVNPIARPSGRLDSSRSSTGCSCTQVVHIQATPGHTAYVGCARPNRARADPATTSSLLARHVPFLCVCVPLSLRSPQQPWTLNSCERAVRRCHRAACSTSPSFRHLVTTPARRAQSRLPNCRRTIRWGRKYGSSTHGQRHSCQMQSACPT